MQTMFVITGLACQDHQSDPDFALAHNAAVQAVRTAVHMAPELDARTIYLGSPLKGYIQGQPTAPPHPVVNLLLQAYRTLRPKEQYLTAPVYQQHEQYDPTSLVPHPAVLQHSWNTTDRLVELALKLASDYSPDPGIYPHALLTHDGLVLRPEDLPRTDVFGDPLTCCQQEDEYRNDGHNHHRTGRHTSDRYFREDMPGIGKSYAIMPMVEIAQARYHADYVRTLADYPGRMAIQLSWN